MRLPSWRFKNTETNDREDGARRLHEAAWPDMFANLQSAYAELTNAQFELERRTSEIAETRDLFQQVVSSMTEALFLTDRSGRVIRANPAAATLLECPETSILGRPLTAVCGSDEIPATPWKLMELAPTGRLTNLEIDIYTIGGAAIPVSFSLGLMHDKQNKITGVLAVARDMREHSSLINSLVAARTRFQELLEFAPDAIILANQEGRIVLVNSQTEKLFGYRRDEILGQSAEILTPGSAQQQSESVSIIRQDSPLDLDDNPFEMNGASEQFEFNLTDRAGHEFVAEITRRQIDTEDGILIMSLIRDITERRRIAVALDESEERYRNVAETASDVIMTVDDDGHVQFVNSSVQRVFGYRPAEVEGKDLIMLMPEYLRDLHKAGMKRYLETGKKHIPWAGVELTGLHKDGHEVPIEVAFNEYVRNGRRAFTGIIRDITERKRVEAARREAINLFVATFFGARHLNWLHAFYGVGAALGPLLMTAVLAAGWSWRWGNAAIALVLAALALAYFATRNVWSVSPSPGRVEGNSGAASAPITPWQALRLPAVRLQVAAFFVLTGLEATAGQWSYTVLTEARGVEPAVAGICVGGFWAAFTLARILAGAVVARIGNVRLARLSAAGALAGVLLFAWAPAALPLAGVAGLWLTGFSLGPLFPGLMAETPRRLGTGAAAHAVGFQVAAAVVGMAAVPALAGSLAHGFGLDAAAGLLVPVGLLFVALHERIIAAAGDDPRDR